MFCLGFIILLKSLRSIDFGPQLTNDVSWRVTFDGESTEIVRWYDNSGILSAKYSKMFSTQATKITKNQAKPVN